MEEKKILTTTGIDVERLDWERTDSLEDDYNKEENPEVKQKIEHVLFERYRRDYRPNKREGDTSETKWAKMLENVINNCSFSQRDMAKYFCQHAHRYLDQSLFEGFIRHYIIIHAWKWRNSKPGVGPVYYDGRNQYTCEACSTIVEALGWEYYYDHYCRELDKEKNQ